MHSQSGYLQLTMRKYFTQLLAGVGGLFLSAVPVLASTSSISAGLANAPGVNLTIQSLFGIVAGLACWSTRFVTIIMVVMIVWYGFQMMAAQSNATKFTEARKGLGYAVVGMIVILGAYTIIATVGNAISSAGTGPSTTSWLNYTPLGSCSGTGTGTATCNNGVCSNGVGPCQTAANCQ